MKTIWQYSFAGNFEDRFEKSGTKEESSFDELKNPQHGCIPPVRLTAVAPPLPVASARDGEKPTRS
jgi:hypothetical protein